MTDIFNYTEMLATADELMDFFGQSATLVIPGAKSGDAWNPTSAADTTETCTIVETEYNASELTADVLATDKKILVKAGDLSASIVPLANQITYGSVTYNVINVEKIAPAGTVLLWIIQARA